MKRFAMLLSVILICSALSAQEEKKSMSPQEKAWTAYMTPGPGQELLKQGEGTWKTHMTTWMKPGAEPQASDGTVESKLVLGGRYLQSEMHGKMMGQDYEGIGTDAYDNALGEYQSTWIDNMGTGIMMMRGKMDPKTKVISFEGKTVNPQTKKEQDIWATFTQPDNDHQKFEMFTKSGGKKFKMMEITYERQK